MKLKLYYFFGNKNNNINKNNQYLFDNNYSNMNQNKFNNFFGTTVYVEIIRKSEYKEHPLKKNFFLLNTP